MRSALQLSKSEFLQISSAAPQGIRMSEMLRSFPLFRTFFKQYNSRLRRIWVYFTTLRIEMYYASINVEYLDESIGFFLIAQHHEFTQLLYVLRCLCQSLLSLFHLLLDLELNEFLQVVAIFLIRYTVHHCNICL